MKRLFVLVAALALTAGVAQADLLGHWAFEGNLTDSVSATVGTAVGGAALIDDDAAAGSGSLEVLAVGDYVDTGVDPTLGGASTFAAFVKTTSEEWGAVVSDNYYDEPGGRILGLGNEAELWNDIGWVGEHREDATVGDGEWHHIAWTLAADGTSIMYFDGVAVGTRDPAYPTDYEAFTTDVTMTIFIGGGGFSEIGGVDWFQYIGLIDDVRVYDEVLDATAIAELAEGGGAVGEPELRILSGMDENGFVHVGEEIEVAFFFGDDTEGTIEEAGVWDGVGCGEGDGDYTNVDGNIVDGRIVITPTASMLSIEGIDFSDGETLVCLTLEYPPPPPVTEGAPVAGMLGLGLAAAACALGGALTLRKK